MILDCLNFFGQGSANWSFAMDFWRQWWSKTNSHERSQQLRASPTTKRELPPSFPPGHNTRHLHTKPPNFIPIREVPRSADFEYEYVWVSRILTRWPSVPRRTYWQNEYEYEYDIVGRMKIAAPRPLRVPRPLSRTLCVCRLTAVVYENTLRLSSRHFFTAVKLIRKVQR